MRDKILKELQTAWAGQTCLCFDVLESTNDYAKELAKQTAVHGTLIITDTQTAGRGRAGRSWKSESGTNIAMSLCVEPNFPAEAAAGLTLVMALSAAEAMKAAVGTEPQIKWPNDIVVNGKKVCGILTELIFTARGFAVIIGVGINVNTREFPEEIAQTAGSLKQETGKTISREVLAANIMKCFEEHYEQYVQTGDLSLMKEQYERMLANKGREVRVLDPNGAYEGIAKGISNTGNLRVVCADGAERRIDSGEVSVRGLYGYV